jgi:tetrahydromethanopterin S-methyltransferase subunit B
MEEDIPLPIEVQTWIAAEVIVKSLDRIEERLKRIEEMLKRIEERLEKLE